MRYLLFSLIFLAIWIVIFWFNRRLRREMLTISLFFIPFALLEPFFVPQYWSPDALISQKLSVEDFIFVFSVGGIMSVLYELVIGKVLHRRLRDSFGGEIKHAFILGIGLATAFVIYFFFKINFMYAIFVGYIINLLIMFGLRRDLLTKMLGTSLLFGLLYFVVVFSFINLFNAKSFWNEKALSGIIIAGVPLEEVLWAAGAGAMTGPMYEFLMSVRLVKRKQ